MSKHIYVDDKLVAIDGTVTEKEEPNKYTIKIYSDPEQEYPYEHYDDKDKQAILYSNHKYYNWDNHNIEELFDKCDNSVSLTQLPRKLEEIDNTYRYFPIYMFEHGQATISAYPFNDPWDSGLLGYLKVDNKDGNAEKIRDSWVKCIKNWVEGNYVRFVILNEMNDVVDGVCGFEYDNKLQLIKDILSYIPSEYNITTQDVEKAIDNIIYM